MTKLEVIKINKAQYAEYSKKIDSMTDLEKVVAENLVLAWIKGNNWMGGLSDSKAQVIFEKLMKMGYDLDELMNEYDRQIALF